MASQTPSLEAFGATHCSRRSRANSAWSALEMAMDGHFQQRTGKCYDLIVRHAG